jgi:hypothetical protein
VPTRYRIPIFLNITDFDDTEMVQAARDVLHRIFVDLAAQTHEWKLIVEELQQLSLISQRASRGDQEDSCLAARVTQLLLKNGPKHCRLYEERHQHEEPPLRRCDKISKLVRTYGMSHFY